MKFDGRYEETYSHTRGRSKTGKLNKEERTGVALILLLVIANEIEKSDIFQHEKEQRGANERDDLIDRDKA